MFPTDMKHCRGRGAFEWLNTMNSQKNTAKIRAELVRLHEARIEQQRRRTLLRIVKTDRAST